jgi:hypothetical protein
MVIDDYFINDCWWFFYCEPLMVILLVTIDGYLIVAINGYFISGY